MTELLLPTSFWRRLVPSSYTLSVTASVTSPADVWGGGQGMHQLQVTPHTANLSKLRLRVASRGASSVSARVSAACQSWHLQRCQP